VFVRSLNLGIKRMTSYFYGKLTLGRCLDHPSPAIIIATQRVMQSK